MDRRTSPICYSSPIGNKAERTEKGKEMKTEIILKKAQIASLEMKLAIANAELEEMLQIEAEAK